MTAPRCLPAETPFILEFRGPDAGRYLNGQLTQDIGNLGDRSLKSCVTDAKGKLQYFIEVCHGPDVDAFWIVCPQGQQDGLAERLEKYLIADEVEVSTLDGWTRIHSEVRPSEAKFERVSTGVFGEGRDHWWPADEVPDWSAEDPGEIEHQRILRRLPTWGSELEPGMLPPDAGLDATAISYLKGCYIGQEVLSRIKSAGRLNRRLAGFEVPPTARVGDRMILNGTEVGSLTSVSPLRSAATPALGYLGKKGFGESSFNIVSDEGEIRGPARWTAWA